MNKERMIFGSIGIASVVFTLLPWINATVMTFPGTSKFLGIVVLAASIITIVLSFMGNILEAPKNHKIFMILGGIMVVSCVLEAIFILNSGASTFFGGVGIGFGLILSLISGIILAVAPKFINKI